MDQTGVSPTGGGRHSTAAAAIAAARRKPTLVQIGSALGIASNCIGWAIFLMLCMGFTAASVFSPLPFALAVVGFVLTIIGGVTQKHADVDTHVLASIFLNIFGIVGGLLELAVWRQWTVLMK